jgi:uncharacterized protein YcgI (DUF1989 family)
MHFSLEKFCGFAKNHYLCNNYRRMRMRKNLLIISMMAFLAVPAAASTTMVMERGVAEMIDEPITLTIDGNAVTISGAQGQKLIVVSLTGRQVAEYQIDSPAQRIELNLTKGCYVLKVGNVVRKVSIR